MNCKVGDRVRIKNRHYIINTSHVVGRVHRYIGNNHRDPMAFHDSMFQYCDQEATVIKIIYNALIEQYRYYLDITGDGYMWNIEMLDIVCSKKNINQKLQKKLSPTSEFDDNLL